ncbi:MAG: hypothetical protein PHV60_04990 [bacterium]|nr:hypothetical protein [bacterium]
MKKILLMVGLIVLFGSFCFAEVSPFLPQWQIGDTWTVNYYTRETGHLEAAWELPVRRLGEFRAPSLYSFKVINRKLVKNSECYVVEKIRDPYNNDTNKTLIYFRITDLNIMLIENYIDGKLINDEVFSGGELVQTGEMFGYGYCYNPWPDFSNVSLESPIKMIGTTQQELKVDGDTLTITWKELYNEQTGKFAGSTTQIWHKGSKWWSKYWVEGNDGEDGKEGQWNVLEKAELVSDIAALINIEPDTLNMKSQGKNISCYIELPKEYRPEDIDIGTILLNDVVGCEPSPTSYPDSDKNGIRELMVKFDREEVIALLSGETEEVLTVTGKLKSSQSFKGEDKIKVIAKKPRLKGLIRSCQWYDRVKGIVCIDLSLEPKGIEKIKNIMVKEVKTSKGVSFDPKLSPALPYEIREMSPMYVISQKPCFKIEPGIKKIEFVVKGTCQDENGRIFDFKFGKRFRIEKIKDFQEDIVQE